MAELDLDALLALLRDPSSESRQIAEAAGSSREEAGRASRLAIGIGRARPEDAATLPGPLAGAVARAALGAQRVDLLLTLAAHPSKEAAKEAKRALHLLKARGLEVPEPPRAAALPAPLPGLPEPPLRAYASAIDGHGERAVWLPRILGGRGVEIAQAVLSDLRGLVELQIGLVGRREWRVFARGLLDRGQTLGVAELDAGLVVAMIASARALNERAGQHVPAGADAWIGQLGPVPTLPDASDAFPALPEEEEREAVAQSGRIHDLPLLRGWLADEALLRGVAATLDGIAVSPSFTGDAERAAEMARVISDALSSWFDAERTALFAARLFETAAHLDRAGDPSHARLAAAAARALRSGVPPHRIPAARLLLQKAFPAANPGAGLPSPGPLIVPAR
jgi:hypothetical protein